MTPEEIKKLRIQLMLTQNDFAIVVGVKRLTVNAWEKGNRRPSLRYIRKMKQIQSENLCNQYSFLPLN